MPIVIDLTGRTVLVTGGTRGVGAGIVRQFLLAGAAVETCGLREDPELPSYRRDGAAAGRFAGVVWRST